MILAKESFWIRLPPWTILLDPKSPLGFGECSDQDWPWVVEQSGHHWTCRGAAPGWMVHGQTWTHCQGGLPFVVWSVMLLFPQLDIGCLEAKAMKWQYQHGSVPFTMNSLFFVMPRPSMRGLEAGPPVADSHHLSQSRMMMWNFESHYIRDQLCPDQFTSPAWLMISGTLVVRDAMLNGRYLEGKHSMDNKKSLFAWMPVRSHGVRVASSVNSDSSTGWAQVQFAVMKIECWGMWGRINK